MSIISTITNLYLGKTGNVLEVASVGIGSLFWVGSSILQSDKLWQNYLGRALVGVGTLSNIGVKPVVKLIQK